MARVDRTPINQIAAVPKSVLVAQTEEKDAQRILSALDRACDDLMKSVDVLKARVEPVMGPEPPIADNPIPNCNSEYFSRIMGMIARVRSSVDNIDRIVSRLEV